MRFCVIGCNHRTAPIAMRERLAFDGEHLTSALQKLSELPSIAEGMLLSTCNRVEFYTVARSAESAAGEIRQLIARERQIGADELDALLYCHTDDEALKHIFRVTCSLDAMVVGEAQIMGQVKRAFAHAQQSGAVGPLLDRCMSRAFAIAKRVRSETDIARHPASLSSVAVDLAGRIFEDLSAVALLVVGAGEMAELALTHLATQGATRIRVINRRQERAQALAERFSGQAVPLESLARQLEWADVVITSTGSPKPIIDKALLAPLMRKRRQKPLFIVDIAVPRDVSDDARSVRNLYLFDLDDLEQVVAENLKARRREAKAAERMVVTEVSGFGAWIKSLDVVPLIKQMRSQFGEVARQEALRAARRLRLESPEQREAIQQLADAIAKRLLHRPTTALKRAAADPASMDLGDAARSLFGLEQEPVSAAVGEEAAQADAENDSEEACNGMERVEERT